MDKTKKNNALGIILPVLKGSLCAVVISLIGILFFAFIIKLFGITDGWLKPVNQVIKTVSIFIGVLLGLSKNSGKGLIKGLAIGLVYTLLAFLIFSILNGNFCFDKSLLTDILFGGIMGAICGVMVGSIKYKKKLKASC